MNHSPSLQYLRIATCLQKFIRKTGHRVVCFGEIVLGLAGVCVLFHLLPLTEELHLVKELLELSLLTLTILLQALHLKS